KVLDYSRHLTRNLQEVWWKSPIVSNRRTRVRAGRLLDSAIVEHNRWTVDRALDGWRKTPRPDKALRDNKARLHHNMHGWASLDPNTRRWDSVLLRALVAGSEGQDRTVTAWRKKTHRLVLVAGDVSADPATNAPRSRGFEPAFVGKPIPADVTE